MVCPAIISKNIYNFLPRVLLEKLNLSKVQKNVELVVDRCKNKEEVRDLNQYLMNQQTLELG